MPMHWWGWYNGLGLHWIWMALFWVAVIGGIVWLVRGGTHVGCGGHHDRPRNSGLEILDERYARGEISKEEYLEMRDTLKQR